VVAIDDVALKYVKKKEGCFVVKTVLTPSG
jgi:hypothetical protein